MQANFKFSGMGHAIGSRVVYNRDIAKTLGIEPGWFEKRTGISKRRVCGENEDVLSMASEAIQKACADANLNMDSLGHETILIYIQNGITHLTPPPAIVLCNHLKLYNVRTFCIDGVCSEPINALEIAALMINQKTCDRVIIASSVDFIPVVNPQDLDTVGLFGSGAGALILEKDDKFFNSGLKNIYWMNQTDHWDLGVIPLIEYNQNKNGVEAKFGYYKMKGKELARVALKIIPYCFEKVLNQSDWNPHDIEIMITHQPNPKMLEIGKKSFLKNYDINPDVIMPPSVDLGNMGPASILIAISMAKQNNKIKKGTKSILISFGLGFSCGVAAVVF